LAQQNYINSFSPKICIVSAVICLMYPIPSSCFCLVLTLDQATELAIKNNSSLKVEQLEKQKQLLDLAMEAFQEGLISIDRTYDIRDALLETENEYLYVLLERIQKWSSLQIIMGGASWK